MASASNIVVDTETYWDSTKLLGIGFCVGDFVAYLPFGHVFALKIGEENLDSSVMARLDQALSGKNLIMHNAKFDVKVLRQAGFKLQNCTFDCTMMMSYYIDEYPPHDLDKLGIREVNMESKGDWQKMMAKLKRHGFSWHEYPPIVMGAYCISDCKITWALWEKFGRDLESYTDLTYYHDQIAFGINVLGSIESVGIPLNRELTQDYAHKCEKRILELHQEIGFDPAKRTLLARKLFSEPPIGLGFRPLYGPPSKSTGQRQPIMDEAQLSRYNHPLIGLVKEHRDVSKRLSTYLRRWLTLSESDGRVHPNFNQNGTVTGRLSGDLQQIPRDSYLKDLFRPSDGCTLLEFDYSQIEYRLAAAYAKEQKVLVPLREGADFHEIVAALLSIPRQSAKTINYLILFGGGVDRLRSALGINYREADEFLSRYHAMFPGFKRAAYSAQAAAQSKGSIKYWTPRIRRFKYSSEYHKAFNSVIQGGANEIIRTSMTELHKAGYTMMNQVHDSVWIELPKRDCQNGEVDKIKSIMSDWCLSGFGIPFPVDVKSIGVTA